MKNPLIEEVRKARAALAAECGHDRQKVFEWAKAGYAARNPAAAKPATQARRKSSAVSAIRPVP
jgi:hypothetical protein